MSNVLFGAPADTLGEGSYALLLSHFSMYLLTLSPLPSLAPQANVLKVDTPAMLLVKYPPQDTASGSSPFLSLAPGKLSLSISNKKWKPKKSTFALAKHLCCLMVDLTRYRPIVSWGRL